MIWSRFFIKYRLQVRIFDCVYKLVYKHDPIIRNPHNKVLYCMFKGDHIYTLNYNIKSLEQQHNQDAIIVKASQHYRID